MLALANATSSSVYAPEYGPERAVAFDPDSGDHPYHPDCCAQPYCSAAATADGEVLWWQADIAADTCVRTVSVFGDMRVATDHHFRDVGVELLDRAGTVLWQSARFGTSAAEVRQHVALTIPGALCCCSILRVTKRAARPGDVLCLSAVRCFGTPVQSRLLLARHGEADHNVGGNFDPICGPALTAWGQNQAAQLARTVLDSLGVTPNLILVSPQRRALETAAIVRQCEPRLRQVPVEILRAGYEHAWHEELGAQIPPADVSTWPDGTEEIVKADDVLTKCLHASLSPPKGIPGIRQGRVAGQMLAPLENATGARARGREILAQLQRRAEARLQGGQPAEPVVLLIAHGGINHDILCSADPIYSPFMLQHHQKNGEVKCVAMPF